MKTIKYFIIVILIVFSFNMNAQNYSQDSVYTHGIGFAAGFSTGYGLTYRYMPHKLGIQTTIGSMEEDFSFGVTPIYVIQRHRMANLLLYNGNSFLSRDKHSKDILIVNSFGFGFEINSDTPFSISLMGGIASFYEPNDWRASYTIDVAVFYRL